MGSTKLATFTRGLELGDSGIFRASGALPASVVAYRSVDPSPGRRQIDALSVEGSADDESLGIVPERPLKSEAGELPLQDRTNAARQYAGEAGGPERFSRQATKD
jgi:hypothetical protein